MSQLSEEFRDAVSKLVDRIEATLAGSSWSYHREAKRMRDESRTVYTVPALTLVKGGTRLLLDPLGYGLADAEAGVDLYLLPPYDPVASFYLEAGDWYIQSPFPDRLDAIETQQEWPRVLMSQDALRSVLESIAEHAVPSV